MVKGKGRYDWQHTSGQMALLINMFSEGKKVHPKDLNPYEPKTPGMTVPLEFLKDIFVNRKK